MSLVYIEKNANFIPHYGERYLCGERIASSFVESTVNQVVCKRFVKKQPMRWSKKGAHLHGGYDVIRVEHYSNGKYKEQGSTNTKSDLQNTLINKSLKVA